MSKTVSGETTYFGYEYDKVVIELDGSGNQTARNLYGTNLISRTVGNQTLYYQFNGHADVTALTDASGVVVASYYYDAFGVTIGQSGGVDNPFRYAGYEFDDETGLYYLKNRFYDSSVARFTQEDPYFRTHNNTEPNVPTIMQSLNLYVYCMNNPLRYTDPTGYAVGDITTVRINSNDRYNGLVAVRVLYAGLGGVINWDSATNISTFSYVNKNDGKTYVITAKSNDLSKSKGRWPWSKEYVKDGETLTATITASGAQTGTVSLTYAQDRLFVDPKDLTDTLGYMSITSQSIDSSRTSYNYNFKEYYVTSSNLTQMGWNENNSDLSNIKELNRVLKKYDITSAEGIRHFMSQASIESEFGATLTEKYNGTPEAYFTFISGGEKYRGSGYMQLSHDYAYREFYEYMKLEGTDDFYIMSEGYRRISTAYAWESAGWFWSEYKSYTNLKGKADSGASVSEITRIIQGGQDQLAKRQVYYDKAKEIFK